MKLSRWCPLVASISAVFLNTVSSTALANDDWWFDVEVIAFKRNVALTELEEQFSLADNLSAPRAQADIISDVIAPDISYLKQGLPVCGEDTSVKWPSNALISVPSKDVDFLSLPKNENGQPSGAQIYEELSATREFGTDLNSELSSEPDAELNSELTPEFTTKRSTINNASPDPSYTELGDEDVVIESEGTNAPDAQTIASYWASFFGVNDATPITVPAFKYCEEAKPWLSATITLVPNEGATPDNTKKAGLGDETIDDVSDSPTLQSAIVWKVHHVDNRMPTPASLPIIVEGHDWPLSSKAHLLTSNQQALASISRQIRSNRDLERLFHATWRQPVMFGKSKAFNVRLFGGQNYAQQFSLDGEMREQTLSNANNNDFDASTSPFGYDSTSELAPNQSAGTNTEFEQPSSELFVVTDIFTELEERLAKPEAIDYSAFKALEVPVIIEQGDSDTSNASLRTPIWEIDGTMKVFLKYINRVPYLHIDSEMFYRQPVPISYFSSEDESSAMNNAAPLEYKLVSVPLAEQRRVISTQLHYFDHPLFGFVVQIRRYNRPEISE
ncbi:CsiV family protein [Alteromonas gracilis]|uniref:CsiV family protein n=1 Tax=Alteromonas gracilis TaxID=1479524 RepID=UPI0037364ACD